MLNTKQERKNAVTQGRVQHTALCTRYHTLGVGLGALYELSTYNTWCQPINNTWYQPVHNLGHFCNRVYIVYGGSHVVLLVLY